MTEYKDKLNSFASRLKTEPALGTMQEVRPKTIKTIPKEVETQLNIWIPKSLMKTLKKNSIEKDVTIKDSVIEAIKKHLINQNV
jgi:hypothetical protein